MSAMGGVADMAGKEVDFAALNAMRLSLCLRGRKRSTAFLYGGVGIFYNESYREGLSDEASEKQSTADGVYVQRTAEDTRQPFVYERADEVVALCVEGDFAQGRLISEKYLTHGISFACEISGGFALCLYDSKRHILMLARDARGRYPLYYRICDGRIYFSSEIKGLIHTRADRTNGILVDKDSLCRHITAPMGVYGAADIYKDITEVGRGECLIFTEYGMSRMRIPAKHTAISPLHKSRAGAEERLIWRQTSPSTLSIFEGLDNALIAFDYPQFDCYMPWLMQMLEENGGRGGRLYFEDEVRRGAVGYAYEREDRLKNIFDVDAVGILPQSRYAARTRSRGESEAIYAEHMQMKRELVDMVECMDSEKENALRRVMPYAGQIVQAIKAADKSQEETRAKIRILGMMYQCGNWLPSRNFLLA